MCDFSIEVKEFENKTTFPTGYLIHLALTKVREDNLLKKYLKTNNIKRFLPFKKLTYDIKNDILEICYYHNACFYKGIYETKSGINLVPNIVVETDLFNNFYKHYLLNNLAGDSHSN
jgi:hypothetical protein